MTPDTGVATVVLIATDQTGDLDRALAGLAAHAPEGTSVIVVADAPSAEQEAALDRIVSAEGRAVAHRGRLDERAAGARRRDEHRDPTCHRSGRHPARHEPGADRRPRDARWSERWTTRPSRSRAAGASRRATCARSSMRRPATWTPSKGYAQAFRRSDAAERGPLDERFRFYRNLDIWWSLVLRDEGEGEPPRRAVRVAGLPVTRHEHRGWTSLPDEERDRQSKRNFYRIIDRFGWRRDLLVGGEAAEG